jgi:hypothetical protein
MFAFSTAKVEYMVATHACNEAIWIMKLYLEVGISQRAIIVRCDCNNTILLVKLYVECNLCRINSQRFNVNQELVSLEVQHNMCKDLKLSILNY